MIDTLIGERCEFAATGHLYIAADPGDDEKLAQYAEDAEAHGLSIERLSGDELRQRWPWLGGGFTPNVLGAGHDGKPAAGEPCRDEGGAASRRRPLPEHP